MPTQKKNIAVGVRDSESRMKNRWPVTMETGQLRQMCVFFLKLNVNTVAWAPHICPTGGRACSKTQVPHVSLFFLMGSPIFTFSSDQRQAPNRRRETPNMEIRRGRNLICIAFFCEALSHLIKL